MATEAIGAADRLTPVPRRTKRRRPALVKSKATNAEAAARASNSGRNGSTKASKSRASSQAKAAGAKKLSPEKQQTGQSTEAAGSTSDGPFLSSDEMPDDMSQSGDVGVTAKESPHSHETGTSTLTTESTAQF